MSLMNLSPQSAGGRVLRVNVLNKLKNAISLVVTRGADAEGEDGAQRVVFKQEGSGGDWVLSGAYPSYIFSVTARPPTLHPKQTGPISVARSPKSTVCRMLR